MHAPLFHETYSARIKTYIGFAEDLQARLTPCYRLDGKSGVWYTAMRRVATSVANGGPILSGANVRQGSCDRAEQGYAFQPEPVS